MGKTLTFFYGASPKLGEHGKVIISIQAVLTIRKNPQNIDIYCDTGAHVMLSSPVTKLEINGNSVYTNHLEAVLYNISDTTQFYHNNKKTPFNCREVSLPNIQKDIFQQALRIYGDRFFVSLLDISKRAQRSKTRRLEVLRCIAHYMQTEISLRDTGTKIEKTILNLNLKTIKTTIPSSVGEDDSR
ncbi:MAG: hypothetical protein V3U57_04475 [Robiginitomaculum sp.]